MGAEQRGCKEVSTAGEEFEASALAPKRIIPTFSLRPFRCSFSSTDVDPNYDRLTFVVGKGQVTQALEEGVQRLVVGDEAVIVGAPSMCYGDIGLPGYVSGKSYVVYEVELLSSVEGASGTECFGPEGLVKKDAKAKVAKSGLGVAIDSSVTR